MDQIEKQERKIRVLALCDSPTSATGFAQVSRNILRGLGKTGKYDIDILGINFYGEYYDRTIHPYNIYPAQPQGYQDMYGRDRLIMAITGELANVGLKPSWDIIFTIQDPFIVEGMNAGFPFAEQLKVSEELWKRTVPASEWFKWIGYYPVDASLKENWVTRAVALTDYPVAYCQWGREQMMKWDQETFKLHFKLKAKKGDDDQKKATILIPSMENRIEVIHHGVELQDFYVVNKKDRQTFRKEYFHGIVKPDTFLVVNVSRNQPRKDIPRTMAAFAQFKKKVKKAHLYLHCRDNDLGGSIAEYGRQFNLVGGKDYSLPQKFDAGTGYTIDVVNNIYNAADVCVTTTLGEGWGFITSEAMATKTPVLAPNITSIKDIFNSYEFTNDKDHIHLLNTEHNNLRGIPVKAQTNSSEWVALGLSDVERIRPLTNVDDLVIKMQWVHKNLNTQKLKNIVERGYKWVQTQSWGNIIEKWDKVFQRAYEDLQQERKIGIAIDKAGRNDPCPCGSGVKFKKCHGNPDKMKRFTDWIDNK